MATDNLHNEQELLLQITQGDEQAFTKVFNLFYQRLSYMVIKLVGDVEEAKDILSEIFVKLWDRRTSFQSLSAMKAFLYISARNKSLDFLKTKKRKDASNSGYMYWVGHPEETSALILNAELLALLELEIQSLPDKCREIVRLAYYEGLSSHEIATRLGISLQTVWNQKTTAIKRLRIAFLKSKVGQAGLITYISLTEILKI